MVSWILAEEWDENNVGDHLKDEKQNRETRS